MILTTPSMKHPNDNMLLRIAQGDAYGMAVEYLLPEEHKDLFKDVLKFEKYCQTPKFKEIKAGSYTDDAQMSIGISETLINKHIKVEANYAVSFFDTFKRDPRKGYSRGLQTLLEEGTSYSDVFYNKIKPWSNANGAAMRSVPIGVLPTPSQVLEIAALQAKITHNSFGGIASSQAVALMSHFALYTDFPFTDLNAYCLAQGCDIFKYFDKPYARRVKAYPEEAGDMGVGINTAHAVLTLLKSSSSLLEIAKKTIELGGDTDSVLAIAWGIASCRFKEELPEFFEKDLEKDGKYGPEFLKKLGAELMKKYSNG
jgi:ADP-ribosylglycohydrolase